MTDARKGMLAWAAVIVPTWIVMILCTHWEPVAHDGWVEVYETAGGLPVRVATTDVDPDGTAATFDVSEHTNAGRLLRTYRLDAAVAG